MFKRIKEYKRYLDYYYIKSIEVWLSLSLTILFDIFIFIFLNFYADFNLFENAISDILLCIIGGEFGLLGISLAGMAFITGVISPELLSILKKHDKNNVIDRVMSQFEFSAFNLAIQIILLFFCYFAILSNRTIVSFAVFVAIFSIILYHLLFNILYVVALIGNCIKINNIKEKCVTVKKIEKTDIDILNELRIDYLLSRYLKHNDISSDVFMEGLNEIIDKTTFDNKNELKDYMRKYYKLKL